MLVSFTQTTGFPFPSNQWNQLLTTSQPVIQPNDLAEIELAGGERYHQFWGLLPYHSKRGDITRLKRYPVGRLESASERWPFSRLWDDKRCLIPAVALQIVSRRKMLTLRHEDGHPFYLGGLCDTYLLDRDCHYESFTILTKTSPSSLQATVQRLPVILVSQKEQREWLNTKVSPFHFSDPDEIPFKISSHMRRI